MSTEYQLDAIELACMRGHHPLFKQLSFSVSSGEILHIKGGNGVGKTSLLRLLAGLMDPVMGKIHWQHAIAEQDYYQSISYMSHQSGLRYHLTVVENCRLLCCMSNNLSLDLDALLEKFHLNQHVMCKDLSSGQKQRLGLARLLIQNNPVWLLDEPFSSLDEQGIDLLKEMLSAHIKRNNIAIIASHQSRHLSAFELQTLTMSGINT